MYLSLFCAGFRAGMFSSGGYVSSGGLSFARICGKGAFDVGDRAGTLDLVVRLEDSGADLTAAAEEASRIKRCELCACSGRKA